MRIYIQATTFKAHADPRCSVLNRTRNAPLEAEDTAEVRQALEDGTYTKCQKCWTEGK